MVTSIHLVQLTRRECFLNYSTHKFRSTFGKSRLIRDGQKVLVAFSGGQASVAMLHLITEVSFTLYLFHIFLYALYFMG